MEATSVEEQVSVWVVLARTQEEPHYMGAYATAEDADAMRQWYGRPNRTAIDLKTKERVPLAPLDCDVREVRVPYFLARAIMPQLFLGCSLDKTPAQQI
jgi:hypothetical protein